MKSGGHGEPTSAVELTNVSQHGLWVLMDGREHFLSFDAFPWFRDATIAQLGEIERPAPHHLRWPALDVDLSIDSVDHPELYPLVSGVGAQVRESRDEGPVKD